MSKRTSIVVLMEACSICTSANIFKRQVSINTFTKWRKQFDSFLMDGSTESGNVEDKLFLVQYCIQDDTAQEIRSCAHTVLVITSPSQN